MFYIGNAWLVSSAFSYVANLFTLYRHHRRPGVDWNKQPHEDGRPSDTPSSDLYKLTPRPIGHS